MDTIIKSENTLCLDNFLEKISPNIAKLPLCIENEIFSFLLPDISTIKFGVINNEDSSDKYKTAYSINNGYIIKNKKGLILCRIEKKNGKHRYYITNVTRVSTCDSCNSTSCNGRYCRGGLSTEYFYDSKYIGKNLNYALLQLFYTFDK